LTQAAHPFSNPGRTKLALVSLGVSLPEGLAQAFRWVSMANAVETVIDLRLPSGHFCTVPVGTPAAEKSPISLLLRSEDGKAELRWGSERLPAQLVPAPSFYRRRTKNGARMGSFAALHDRLLVLYPYQGCGFFARKGEACRFCLYDSMLNAERPPLRDPLELVEAVHAALAEREVDTVYLYSGFSPEPDRGLERLAGVVALLRRHLGHRQIAVEALAPEDLSAIEVLYAAGADIFVCNLELFDRTRFAELCPGKQAHGGQEAIWRALEHARGVFRAGCVASNLIVGLEPIEATKKGVDALIEAGIAPLLVPFRPVPGTPLADRSPPQLAVLEETVVHWYRQLSSSGLPLHRLRDMGRVLTPMESRVFVGGRPSLTEQWRISSFGRRLGAWADALRRRLRVQGEKVERGPIVRVAAQRLLAPASLLALLAVGYAVGAQPPPEGLSVAGWRALVVFLLCAVLWATQLVPLPVASLFGMGLLPAVGVMPAEVVFSFFGSAAVFFVLGAFVLAAGLVRLGVAERLAIAVLDRFGASPRRLLWTMLLLPAALATVMPEHAAAAIVLPMAGEIVRRLGVKPTHPYAQALLLAAAWGAVIGGVITMLGGARAPLALAILQSTQGEGFSFAEWMQASVPIALPCLLFAGLLLSRTAVRLSVSFTEVRRGWQQRRLELGALDVRGRMQAILVGLTVLAWIAFGEGIGLAAISLLAVFSMFALRLVDWRAVEREVAWGVVLLYGGAIALGNALAKTGAASWLAAQWIDAEISPLAFFALLAGTVLLLTELVSNAAAVAIVLPVVLPMAEVLGIPAKALALAVGVMAGFAFVFPIGTPANAMAVAEGATPSSMRRWGLMLALFVWTLFVATSWIRRGFDG